MKTEKSESPKGWAKEKDKNSMDKLLEEKSKNEVQDYPIITVEQAKEQPDTPRMI